MRSLTRGQTVVLTVAAIPMAAVGIGGAIGTYANARSVLHRSETALGVVSAGEGATLVAALVMLGLTMLGQSAPITIRAALWLLPGAASVMGLAIAPSPREAVVFAITPLAMTVSAEGLGLLARRIVVHHSGTDMEAQRRNATTMRRIAYLQARAENHPNPRVRKRSALEAWRLMSRVGAGDTELGSGLISVQRQRLTTGADAALSAMLTGSHQPTPSEPPALPEPSEPPAEPDHEPADEPDFDTFADGALRLAAPEPRPKPHRPVLPPPDAVLTPLDQHVSREPVASPAEPAPDLTTETPHEPTPEPTGEPEPTSDPIEAQVIELTSRLRRGDRLTKTAAAELLGVSPATAGRRLKAAKDRLTDGTGMYL
ncbi:hypothetical protein [Streptomyces sp. NPDC006784]|uniref:hypothetical protein n=1 Tax=Streptomyces sp. NPDC006784 TaxID=3364764 RepID=UPI0036C9B7F6